MPRFWRKKILFGWLNLLYFYIINSEIYQLTVFSIVPCQLNIFTFYSCCSIFFNNIFSKGLWMVNTLCLWVSGYFILLSLKKKSSPSRHGFLIAICFFSPLKLAWHLFLKTLYYCWWEFWWQCTCLFLLSHLSFLSRSS